MMSNIINLQQKNWVVSTPLERKAALQALEDHLAHEDGRAACEVHVVPMEENGRGSYGHDAQGNGTIEINRNLVESDLPYQSVETLFHEDRHAHQYHITQHPELVKSGEQLQDWQISEAGGYIQPDETLIFSSYRFQPAEADANRVARERTDALYQNIIQDQNQYHAYKTEKEQEISDAKEYARFELGDNYEEEARQSVRAKYQAIMDMKGDARKNPEAETQVESKGLESLNEGYEPVTEDIPEDERIPVNNSHLSPETREAAEKVDREIAAKEAEMDAKTKAFYKEEDRENTEGKPIEETAPQVEVPKASDLAQEEDKEKSRDNDYYSGYGM